MTTIKSRTDQWAIDQAATQAYHDAMAGFQAEWATEQEELIDRIDSFLELRITAEFDELRDDITQAKIVHDALMEENIRFREEIDRLRDEVTVLSIENLRLSAA